MTTIHEPEKNPKFATYDHGAEFDEKHLQAIRDIQAWASAHDIPMSFTIALQCAPDGFKSIAVIHEPKDIWRIPLAMYNAIVAACRIDLATPIYRSLTMIEEMDRLAKQGNVH